LAGFSTVIGELNIRREQLLSSLDPASSLAVGLLIFAFILVIAFEATNGFHDAANAVATVIYTKSLQPMPAVVWSGFMNFIGVMVGGISVAYALVEILPPEVLSPPSGAPAVAMLVALLVSALFWNIGTWWFALPNSSSHCLIGALIGIALGNALLRARSLSEGVHWGQLWSVLEALALSPVLGFVLSGSLYFVLRHTAHDKHLYEPAEKGAPVWWMRGTLILTCTGVSFAHGTNDGQKSIGLIMLTIIGLFPALFALNPMAADTIQKLPQLAADATPLIQQYGDDQKAQALDAAKRLQQGAPAAPQPVTFVAARDSEPGLTSEDAKKRSAVRNDVYQLIAQLKHADEAPRIGDDDKKQAKTLATTLGQAVAYAPWWVRIMSALSLGIGTMIGYKRIVNTLGERLGNVHLTPAQGASAELVSALLIGISGFSGLPVSTTHIVTSGIGGTMVSSGAGLRFGMLSRIAIAWLVTLPVTIVLAGALYYFLANPNLGIAT
jgi:inorganic phosphate transporter, PiT family